VTTPSRHVVIGTAGHIDHGKTTLVKALTGVDTDRLAEEKARGITIDLGFAPLVIEDVAFSIVDVPGHEGFIRNMVAGATGVDLALLVVAADEGVMPQTREHVAILRFLGVKRGVVALTKIDAAPDAEWRGLVKDDVAALLRDAIGEAWPVAEVSAVSGAGIPELRLALRRAAGGVERAEDMDRFRMPVDRVFALAGAGTIVTGTVWSGAVGDGEPLLVLPAGVEGRVRSVQVHGQAAPRAEPGRRAAVALVGVSREQAARGSVVVGGSGWRISRAVDASVAMVPDQALKLRQRVRVHHGTAEVMARVSRLASQGPETVARFALEEPLVPRAGDHFVLRSYSPLTTIGGAVVLEPWADALPRRAPRLPEVPRDDVRRIVVMVTRRGPAGMTREDLAVAAGLSEERLTAALKTATKSALVSQDEWYAGAGEVAPVRERLVGALHQFHETQPLEPGMPLSAWRQASGVPAQLTALGEQSLVAAGAIERDGSVARLKGWSAGGGAGAEAERERLLEALRAAGAEPPSVAELAAAYPGVDVPGALRFLAREGRVTAVGKDRFYDSGVLAGQRQKLVEAVAGLGQSATASAIRERLGLSRKFLIPLLEWADREGVTKRIGDVRVPGPKGVLDGGPDDT
jgi:selenocysteine-specific elongation factor